MALNLSAEDKAICQQFADTRGAGDLKILNVYKDAANDWRVYLVVGLYDVKQQDAVGRTISTFKTNRYSTIEIKPKRLGGNAIVHESAHAAESRKYAEDTFQNVMGQIRKYAERGHL